MVFSTQPTFIFASGRALSISIDGDVYSFGTSRNGSHGHDEIEVEEPKMIPNLKQIKSIALGSSHSVCLDQDGNVYTFGDNFEGALGIGIDKDTLRQTFKPQKVNLPPCKDVSCGYDFTICVSVIGELYSFGENKKGQLGLGHNDENYNFPQKIEYLNDAEFVECGYSFVFCKTLNNQLFSWGSNSNGELGLGHSDEKHLPMECSLPLLLNEIIVDIKCGGDHTLILTSRKEVYSCGKNYYGQLGLNLTTYSSPLFTKIENLSEIIRIECAKFHSMCIDVNNDFYIFGNNRFIVLGLGEGSNDIIPFPIKHPSLSNIIDISSQGSISFVKTSENEIFSLGWRKEFGGVLHNESKDGIDHFTPIQVFRDKEYIWLSSFNKPRAKSARFIAKQN